MTSAEILRVFIIFLALPNTALVLAFAVHLWHQGKNPVYKQVFRSAVYAYGGMGILLAGVAWGQYQSFDFPYIDALWTILVSQILIMYGMVHQFRQLPKRKW